VVLGPQCRRAALNHGFTYRVSMVRRSRIGRRASAHSGHLGHISNPLSLLVNEQIRVPHDLIAFFGLHARARGEQLH
jgi:hypothetical protein